MNHFFTQFKAYIWVWDMCCCCGGFIIFGYDDDRSNANPINSSCTDGLFDDDTIFCYCA